MSKKTNTAPLLTMRNVHIKGLSDEKWVDIINGVGLDLNRDKTSLPRLSVPKKYGYAQGSKAPARISYCWYGAINGAKTANVMYIIIGYNYVR